MNKLLFFAIAPTGIGISGSDRIFIELAREWSKNIPITIYTTQEGVEMCDRQHLTGKRLIINKIEKKILPIKFLLKYLYKILLGIRLGFTLHLPISNHRSPITYLYSSSDFWMDVFPCVILKIRYPKLKWIATWYMTAPNPLKGFSETKRKETYKISAFLYWFSQLPIRPLINLFADFVIVNNEDERKMFPKFNKKGKIFVMIGAVRLDEIEKYKSLITGYQTPKYDAVFQGRFHPQKGVVELVDIWKKVVDKIPSAKLAMIGDGPLMGDVRKRIQDMRLKNNVKLFGYVFDGDEKYKIFSQSKLVVHPAFYDSGGMASAEAMAFGLPCVGFNLKAYDSYYPKGMIKVPIGNTDAFSERIIKVLKDNGLRTKIGTEALNMIENNWSWENRAKQLSDKFNLI